MNGWPSLGVDLGAALGLAEGMLPAGFYYKTFMWPASAWPLYERFIRRMAGLGRAPTSPDPDRYVKRNAHCDVLVIGAGPAGLTAACEAARSGARVMVVEDRAELGGSLVGAPGTIDRLDADAWVAGQGEALEEAPDVRVLRRTTAVGYYDHNFVVLCERLAEPGEVLPAGQPRERLWRVRARHVILATGAFERPLLFANNDRPGILSLIHI